MDIKDICIGMHILSVSKRTRVIDHATDPAVVTFLDSVNAKVKHILTKHWQEWGGERERD